MLVALWCLGIGQPAYSQKHSFKTYSLNEGVPQSQVLCIEQDRQGFLWLGTLGGGACRFDGIEFEYFSTRNGLPNNNVWDIVEDRDGNLWFATVEGIAKYDGQSFTTLTKKDGLPHNECYSFAQDESGDLWIGTQGGVGLYSNGSLIALGARDGMPEESASDILVRSNGEVWIAHFGSGVSVSTASGIQHFDANDGIADNYVNCLMEDHMGRVWIGTESGISIYDGQSFTTLDESNGLPELSVSTLLQDRNHNYWIGTARSGICHYDGTRMRTFTEAQGLSANGIFSVYEDFTGSIWIGTDGGGMSHYFGDRFIHLTKAEGLSSNLVMALACDRQGNTWLATEDGGFFKYDGNEMEPVVVPRQLAGLPITNLYFDKSGTLWAGFSQTAIGQFDGQNWHTYGSGDGYQVYEALGMCQSPDGKLWVAGLGGLSIFEQDEWTHLDTDAGLASPDLMDVDCDAHGNIWLATASNGIQLYQGGTFTNYNTTDSLPSNFTTTIVCGPHGNVWVGSDRGISRFDGHRFHNYTEDEGLTSNNVYSLIFDHSNNLFAGTGLGLDRLSFNRDFSIAELRYYSYADGFTGVECNAGVVATDSDLNLWFGTISGATRYNYRKDLPNINLPQNQITGLRLFFEEVDWSAWSSGESAFAKLPVELTLPYDKNHLTFDFTGINLKYPEGVTYRFMLEGLEDSLSSATKRREVTYSNLSPGTYTFKVVSGNADNVWNMEPATFQFRIVPPYWQTWWFYSIIAALGMLVVVAFIRIRTQALERSKRELEHKVDERTKELLEQSKTLEKLSLVASGTSEGVLIAGPAGKLEWMNDGFQRLTGYDMEMFTSRFGDSLQAISNIPNFEQRLSTAVEQQQTLYYQTCNPRATGEKLWTKAAITPIFDSVGKLIRFVAIYTDITRQKNVEGELRSAHKDLTDSINYASQIQRALLPKVYELTLAAPESFLFHQPRDIVSGDFPWFHRTNGLLLLAVADCTGHGVPGAFMSMISHELLTQVALNKEVTDPATALQMLDDRIVHALHQDHRASENNDGLDIALCAIHNNRHLSFAGARRPALIVRGTDIIELKPTKLSVGGYRETSKEFECTELELEPGDRIYLFSDGFPDQFGGSNNKKFLMKRFRQLLLSMVNLSMIEQEQAIQKAFSEWQGDNFQVDDVLVMGVEV